jgi:hypothetical protein
MNNNNTKKNTILDIINSNNKISNNIKKNTITNITETNNKVSNTTIENCKKILSKNPMMAMFSIKDIYIGSVGLVLPWIVLLIIVGFIIVI